MKKIVLALLLAVSCLSASAQFAKGTKYISTSLSNMGLSFQKNQFNVGLNATAGYFLEDAWMVYGQLGYGLENVKGDHNDVNEFTIGVGGRYYIKQNGLYLNMGLKYGHAGQWGFGGHTTTDNLYLTPEIGYCFYLNQYVSVEPSVYYDLSVNHFSDQSKVGLRIGFGFYF